MYIFLIYFKGGYGYFTIPVHFGRWAQWNNFVNIFTELLKGNTSLKAMGLDTTANSPASVGIPVGQSTTANSPASVGIPV